MRSLRRHERWVLATLVALPMTGCSSELANDGPDASGPMIRETPPPKGGQDTAAGCDGITEHGECQDGFAVHCDMTGGGEGRILRTDCRALGKDCVVESERGAECREVQGTGGACGNGLTEAGSCVNTTALWCNTATGMSEAYDCAAYGMMCQVNGCYPDGATCCNPQPEICADIGKRGDCIDNTTARWCNGAGGIQLITRACTGGQTCQVDACAIGAYCCDPPVAPPGDHFDSGLDGWIGFGPGYTVTNDAGSALISGDTSPNPMPVLVGIKKVLTIDPSAFILSFKFRAYSQSLITTTNAFLEIRDAAGTTTLYSQILNNGPGGDTGWRSYSKNLSSSVTGKTSVMVMLFLRDEWSMNYMQKNWYDDITVTAVP